MERTDLINKLIKENGYTDYLEIGINIGLNFNSVICENKTSVDPNHVAMFNMTSDLFFMQNEKLFDIVFIDGMHLKENVIRDTYNSLHFLKDNGLIVIHDCLPTSEHHQFEKKISKNWSGTVWKAIVMLAKEGFKMELLEIETGIVILKKETKRYNIPEGELTWEWYQKNFKKLFE